MMKVNYKEWLMLAEIPIELPNKDGLKGKNCDGATVAQLTCLHRFGVGTTGIKYKGQAAILIDIAIERANNHLATPGQMKRLSQAGFQHVGDISFNQAVQYLSGMEEWDATRRAE